MSGMAGASMLRQRRKDVNIKPNRKLDRKSSRGMLYENEELRLRTININAEVERGQTDIKKLKRENDQLKREISALRYEYERLDTMLRERRSSPEHSDDSASVCSACPDCASTDGASRSVAFNELSMVPEEREPEGNKSGAESPCNCEECILEDQEREKSRTMAPQNSKAPKKEMNRVVDVLVHDSPPEIPQFFQSVTSPPYVTTTQPYGQNSQPYVTTSQSYGPTSVPNVSPPPSFSPPPPGFVVAPMQRFHTGGNVEDLLGEVSAQNSPTIQTTYIQQNSVFMCNTKRILQKQCCCQKNEQNGVKTPPESPKHYVTEKNIELTYDYPRGTPIPSTSKKSNDDLTTTTEVASTVVFVERRIPVKPKKFDFFFRSRSAPVGDNEEPIYATVNKLPKRLRRMELANLEKELAYKTGEPDSSTRTDLTTKTDSESQAPHVDDDTSRSEREKSTIPRPDSPKAKKRKRFSLTFKKRERKRREKEAKNGIKNGALVGESDNERLIEEVHEMKPKPCTRHKARINTLSSSSSGPRYKRDSYQEMTTSHSEHERTVSVCSSVNSVASACTHKSRKLSAPPHDGSIPWCGCWGAGCV